MTFGTNKKTKSMNDCEGKEGDPHDGDGFELILFVKNKNDCFTI